MMSKIKAAQSERDRLSMLLAEYVGDVADESTRTTRTHKDALWLLATKLSSAFEHSDPAIPYLFEGAPEINEKGIENLLSLYESGKLRLKQILKQDVYKTEPRVSAGRRKRSVNRYTYAQLEKMKKQKGVQISSTSQVSITQQDTSPSLSATEQKRHKTTEAEKAVLSQLFGVDKNLLENKIEEVLPDLPGWDSKRVIRYLRNNQAK